MVCRKSPCSRNRVHSRPSETTPNADCFGVGWYWHTNSRWKLVRPRHETHEVLLASVCRRFGAVNGPINEETDSHAQRAARTVCLDVLLYPSRTVKRSTSTALHRSNAA